MLNQFELFSFFALETRLPFNYSLENSSYPWLLHGKRHF